MWRIVGDGLVRAHTGHYTLRERILYVAMQQETPFTSKDIRNAIVESGYKYPPSAQSISKHLKERYELVKGLWYPRRDD